MKFKLFFIVVIVFHTKLTIAQRFALHSPEMEKPSIPNFYSPGFWSQQQDSTQTKTTRFFVAYDFGEAAFNQFKSLGSEIGLKFKNDHFIRIAYTNLHLSEKHLSSDFVKAVDGENVTGKQTGLEVFYDFPIITKGLYISPSVGYYSHEYQHTILDKHLKNSSFTFGASISYTESDLFSVKGLYYRFSIPLRFNFDPIKETKLGDTIINSNLFENNIWLFLGYQF